MKGSVIRIGVNEIHVNDPEFFQHMTRTGSKFSKEPQFYRGISFPSSSIGLVDVAKHRVRRQVLAPAFSPERVQELSLQIQGQIEQLCKRFESFAESSQPVNIDAAVKAFTLDVISQIVFGQEFGVIKSPDFHHSHIDSLHDALKKGWIARAFPLLTKISLALPEWISAALFPIPIEEFRRVCQVPRAISPHYYYFL